MSERKVAIPTTPYVVWVLHWCQEGEHWDPTSCADVMEVRSAVHHSLEDISATAVLVTQAMNVVETFKLEPKQ